MASKYRQAPAQALKSCVCTLCTTCMEEYDVVLVVCTTDVAPIFKIHRYA